MMKENLPLNQRRRNLMKDKLVSPWTRAKTDLRTTNVYSQSWRFKVPKFRRNFEYSNAKQVILVKAACLDEAWALQQQYAQYQQPQAQPEPQEYQQPQLSQADYL